MVEETTLSRNSYIAEDNDEVTDDNYEGESNNTPPNTPSLMKEIQAVIARDEVRIFTLEVDEPEPDSEIDENEKPDDGEKKEELKKGPEGNAKEDNQTEEEDDVSDSESVSTIGYTRTEQNERLRDLEQEKEAEDAMEVITIGDEPDENKTENPERDTENETNEEVVTVNDNTKEVPETNDPKEVINREDKLEMNNKIQGGRTPTRSSRRLRESTTTGRQRSPLRLRSSSGTNSSTTSSPTLRTKAQKNTGK